MMGRCSGWIVSVLGLVVILLGAIYGLPPWLTVALVFGVVFLGLAYEVQQINRRLRAEALAKAVEQAEAHRRAREETTIAASGRRRLRQNGYGQLFLEDEQSPNGRVQLQAPDDAKFAQPEVGPIQPHLQPDGLAYSRELVAGSLDGDTDRVSALYRVRAWESNWGQWEYSHQGLRRYEWVASTGQFIDARPVEEAPSVSSAPDQPSVPGGTSEGKPRPE